MSDHSCAVTDCSSPVVARGWCSAHYQRWRHHGDPLGGGPGPKVRVSVVYEDGTKTCTACAERLPLAEFDRDGNAAGGRRSHCKLCRSARMKTWYAANQERQRDRQRVRFASNNEEIRRRDALRYERDKEARLQLATETVHRRRAKLRGAERSDKGIGYISLKNRDGDLCYLCGQEMSFEVLAKGQYNPRRATIEHLIPISHGGLHVWGNVALTCWECNLRRPRGLPA